MAALRQAGGFSLVEVMVAACVLALGVIGSADLQMSAWRATQITAEQGTALGLAADLADRLRAVKRQTPWPEGSGPLLQLDQDAMPQSMPGCQEAICGGGQSAALGAREWMTRLAASLPGARALVCRDAKPWDEAAASYRWECGGGQGGGAPLVIKIGWRHAGATPGLVLAVAP